MFRRFYLFALLGVAASLAAGCDDGPRSAGPAGGASAASSSTRETASPRVPAHAKRAAFEGSWQSDGETLAIIGSNAEGEFIIDSGPNPVWDSVINNVRWEGQTLRYDEYMYYSGPEDFSTINNPDGQHPFSGVRNETSLSLTDDPDKLEMALSTPQVSTSVKDELTRAPDTD